MSYEKQQKVWLLVADLVFLKDLQRMTVVQGHIIGSRLEELNAKLDRWANLKQRQFMDTQGAIRHFSVRIADIDDLPDGEIPRTAEDIEKVLAESAVPGITPAPLDPWLASMEGDLADELARVKRQSWRRAR